MKQPRKVIVLMDTTYWGKSFGTMVFKDAYSIPNNRLYDFLLFCIETTTLNSDFNRQNFAGVLEIFNQKAKLYVSRIELIERE